MDFSSLEEKGAVGRQSPADGNVPCLKGQQLSLRMTGFKNLVSSITGLRLHKIVSPPQAVGGQPRLLLTLSLSRVVASTCFQTPVLHAPEFHKWNNTTTCFISSTIMPYYFLTVVLLNASKDIDLAVNKGKLRI